MGLHETEALVLRSYSLAEADRIVVLLTREHGVVRGVAKGAKRLNSRFGSSLEPFTVIRTEYFQSPERELVSIKHAEIVESLFASASDPDVLIALAYFADVLTAFSQPADPDDRLYRMTRRCVEALVADPARGAQVTTYFEHWILRLGGFLPSWDQCSHCGREIGPDEETAIRADFRISCASCERVRQQNRLAADVRRIRGLAAQAAPDRFVRETAESASLTAELSLVFKKIIATILGKSLGASVKY